MTTSTRHFVRHYVEMLLAMLLGMLVLGGPAMLALGAAGVGSAELRAEAPALLLLGMGVTMTVPMVAWMRHRGSPRNGLCPHAGRPEGAGTRRRANHRREGCMRVSA